MSLSGSFNPPTINVQNSLPLPRRKARNVAPFSIRFSESERARLVAEAAGVPLGTYIKEKLLGSSPVRHRRNGIGVEDRQALARALALLGNARLSSSLNQLARAANIGTLPMTPETEAELLASVRDVRAMRHLLLIALGMKPEGGP